MATEGKYVGCLERWKMEFSTFKGFNVEDIQFLAALEVIQ